MNIRMKKSIHIGFSPEKGRSETSSFLEATIALYQNIYMDVIYQKVIITYHRIMYMYSLVLLVIISLFYCFFVSSVGKYHWVCLHTINIYILHDKPIPVLVLYIVLYSLSLCYEQSLHRQLFIETSIGCSCVWILLDPYPHDH